MVAVAAMSAVQAKPIVAKRAFTGAAVAAKAPQRAVRVASRVVCSKKEQVAAGVTAAAVAVLSNPLAAQAAATPSLNNLIGSLVAGGVVLAGIAVAVSAVSNFDSIRR